MSNTVVTCGTCFSGFLSLSVLSAARFALKGGELERRWKQLYAGIDTPSCVAYLVVQENLCTGSRNTTDLIR